MTGREACKELPLFPGCSPTSFVATVFCTTVLQLCCTRFCVQTQLCSLILGCERSLSFRKPLLIFFHTLWRVLAWEIDGIIIPSEKNWSCFLIIPNKTRHVNTVGFTTRGSGICSSYPSLQRRNCTIHRCGHGFSHSVPLSVLVFKWEDIYSPTLH